MIKVRTFTKTYALGKKRKLTLAAEIGPIYDIGEFPGDDHRVIENVASLDITMAIRNPEDDYIKDVGNTIALGRLDHDTKDFRVFAGVYDTLKYPIFLRADTVYKQMDTVAEWIKSSQDLFF